MPYELDKAEGRAGLREAKAEPLFITSASLVPEELPGGAFCPAEGRAGTGTRLPAAGLCLEGCDEARAPLYELRPVTAAGPAVTGPQAGEERTCYESQRGPLGHLTSRRKGSGGGGLTPLPSPTSHPSVSASGRCRGGGGRRGAAGDVAWREEVPAHWLGFPLPHPFPAFLRLGPSAEANQSAAPKGGKALPRGSHSGVAVAAMLA